MNIPEPIRPDTVTQLYWIHDKEIPCALCNHAPNVLEDTDCDCPMCVQLYPSDTDKVLKDYMAYRHNCVTHGMAPPHADGRDTDTCYVCQNIDAS